MKNNYIIIKNKMIYNNEQWEIIKEATPHFMTARRDYVRNAPRWLTEKIIEVYESATGKNLMSKDLTCAVCVLRIYQAVGKTYFSDLEERNNYNKEKENESDSKQENAQTKTRNNQKKKRNS